MHAACSPQGNAARCLASTTQVPSFLSSVGYQYKMLAFVLAATARIKHFSFVPRQQMKFLVADRPWGSELLHQPAGQPTSRPGQLTGLFSALALLLCQATSNGGKPEQGAAFCFSHARITSGLYHMTS